MSEVKVVYEVSIDRPDRKEGALVQIPGLGTFENGETYEVTDREADAYRTFHTRQKAVRGENGEILGSENELGAPLHEAAETMYGVVVKEVDKTVTVDESEFTPDPEEQADDTEGSVD